MRIEHLPWVNSPKPVRIDFGAGSSSSLAKGIRLFALMLSLMLWVLVVPGAALAMHGNSQQPTQVGPEQLRIDEGKYLGSKIAGDYRLRDANGKSFTLGDMLGKPLVIVLSYYNCDGACTSMNRNLRETLAGMEEMEMEQDYRVLTLSFDRHDNSQRLHKFMQHAGFEQQAPKGWRLALFKETTDITRFTEALGYRHFWSPRDALFLHPNVYILLSAEGQVMRYLYGASIDSKEMELAITKAYHHEATPANVVNFLLATCYSYNYQDGKYAINYPLFIAVGILLFGATIAVIVTVSIKRRRRRECL